MKSLLDQEADRTSLALIVLRPVPGNTQQRVNQLLDAALAAGLRWSDLNDYVDRADMPELMLMLDTYGLAHGLPQLTGERA